MKNIFKLFSVSVIVFISLFSCGKFEDDLNTNPNQPILPYMNGFITHSIEYIAEPYFQWVSLLYAQQLSQITYTDASRYNQKRGDYGGAYRTLKTIQKIIELNLDAKTKSLPNVLEGGSSEYQIAVAKILKSYCFLLITDIFGAIPYSEALKGDGEEGKDRNISPKFDSQKDVYTGIFKELDEAIKLLEDNPDSKINGDILFYGDIDKWKAFANSVGVIASLRLSDVEEATARTEFKKYVGGAADFDIKYNYLPETNNQNPWYENYLTREDYAVSKPMVDKLKAFNDPRLTVYANKSPNKGDYVGMIYGHKPSDAVAKDVSFIGSHLRRQNSPSYIITKSQILFSKAEAAQRGFISGSAKDFYEKAIKASFEQWGLSEKSNKYIAQPIVQYNASEWKRSIGEQKWIALFLQGQEAWSEWRRLDFPKLSPPVGTLNLNENGGIPVRKGYPDFEMNLNKKNYDKAVQDFLGGEANDHLSTRVWWDTTKNHGE